MNVRSINGAAQVICDAIGLDRVPASIARALDASGWLNTTEVQAELARLRLLQNAMPAELSEAQLEALIDAGNAARNDYYHERACSCSEWPNGCATNADYANGYWDSDTFAIAAAAVIGVWESMRAPAEADEIVRLRAEVAEQDEVRVDLWAHLDFRLRDIKRLRARVAELEAAQDKFLLPWAHQIDAKSLDNFVGELMQAADAPLLFVVDEIHKTVARWRELVASLPAEQAPGPVESVEDPHDSPLHHTYTTGRDLPEAPRG